MYTGSFLRQISLFCAFAVAASSVVSAQTTQDESGRQPSQQGGRDRQGGRGGFGGFGGFGTRGPGGGGMAFRVDRAMLLGIDQVRTELKVEESQAAVIDSALDAYREERNSAPRPDRDAFANMSEDERTKMFEEMQKQREELSRKTDEVLNALLEPAQIARLDQIALQMRLSSGLVAALKSDDLREKLKISAEQITKLDAAEGVAREEMQKMMEDMRASFQGGRGPGAPGGAPGAGGPAAGFEAMREKMEAARRKTSDAAMAVLTDAQKSQLEELKGAAFEIDMRAMMGGRGGFGGPGGPGGRGPGGDGGRGEGGRPRGTRPQSE